MTDYNKSTGSSGTMQIKDLGSTVEFWINAGNASTFNHELPWGYTVNGVTNNNREYDYKQGAGWEKLGSWGVSTDQTVTFRLGDTGTSGFGGPTTHSVFINRSTVPAAPGPVTFSALTGTSVTASFAAPGDNGGDAIDAYQIAYNRTNSVVNATFVTSDRSTAIAGLLPGTTYYFFARAHNSKGWGSYSSVRSVTTYRVPDAPNSVVITDVTQSSAHINFQGKGEGGTPVVEWQMAYNTVNSTTGATAVTWTSGGKTVTNLKPGTTYYFWSRGRNSVGWGPYSPVTSAKTLAGVRMNINGVWVMAVPYVKVGGVWKIARPWARVAGFWRETL